MPASEWTQGGYAYYQLDLPEYNKQEWMGRMARDGWSVDKITEEHDPSFPDPISWITWKKPLSSNSCNGCNHDNEPGAKFCSNCGKKL